MSLRNRAHGWGWPARLLHWSSAAVILFLLGLGVWMTRFVPDVFQQFALFQLHKSWGFVAFALALGRIAWRLANPSPRPEAGPAWQEGARIGAHAALYVLTLALPLSGWLTASASDLQERYGIRNRVFDLFALPDPVQPGDAELAELFGLVHAGCAWALIVVLALHVGAALSHHLVHKDRTLMRMIAGK
ncbi:cytochrome b [Albimonas pacifica]|uniref:Cytochrome b561 n=1 Tax=Albimonas pacifica TaxID=1114924 RepID=A0A1I3IRF8_9RHOB|nr:cytochrome b [Albimonas pacifica]SFI50437.1 cytochrome b561 [Albimonas pacifica]